MATLIVWSLTTICMVFWFRHWPKSEVATQVLLSGASANERLDMTASIARALGQTGGAGGRSGCAAKQLIQVDRGGCQRFWSRKCFD